jgi:hypothetical protein
MVRNHSWGVFCNAALLLLPLWLLTGCGDGDSQSDGKPQPDAGPSSPKAIAVNGLVAGGTAMRSPRYRLLGSMTPGVADGTVGVSPHLVARTGLIGASQ